MADNHDENTIQTSYSILRVHEKQNILRGGEHEPYGVHGYLYNAFPKGTCKMFFLSM